MFYAGEEYLSRIFDIKDAPTATRVLCHLNIFHFVKPGKNESGFAYAEIFVARSRINDLDILFETVKR